MPSIVSVGDVCKREKTLPTYTHYAEKGKRFDRKIKKKVSLSSLFFFFFPRFHSIKDPVLEAFADNKKGGKVWKGDSEIH